MIKIYYLFLFSLFCQSTVFAQENWGGGGDDNKLNFGFSFQYSSSEYKILKKSNWRDRYYDEQTSAYVTDSLVSISSPMAQGFGLGFVSAYSVTNFVRVRFTPSLSFTDRVLDYHYTNASKYRQQKTPATMVDLPLAIKIRSERQKNLRAYIIGGVKYSIDIISEKKLDDSGFIPIEKLVKNNRKILSYETGVGLELYFEWFIMRPEIKLSNSFHSVLRPEDNPYSSPLDKLFLRNLQFSLYFE